MIDPRQRFARPPFPQQDAIDMPGSTRQLDPAAVHGEAAPGDEGGYRGSGRLRGLKTLITGGDSGIGRAVAIAYAREGADVLINYLSEDRDAEETVRHVRDAGVRGEAIRGDLTDEAFCNSLIDQAFDRFGGLDVLVNNAAYQETRDSIDQWDTELFDRIYKTNVYATFWLCRAAIPRMKPGSGIINTVSIQAYDPSPELLPYATTKSALTGMTKALAKVAIEDGIRVNAVAPGPVWTPLIPGSMPPDKFQQFGDNTLFGRPAQPIELSPVYVWLASREASYITAEVYGVTGGRSPV